MSNIADGAGGSSAPYLPISTGFLYNPPVTSISNNNSSSYNYSSRGNQHLSEKDKRKNPIIEVDYDMKVIVTSVAVRSGPGISYNQIPNKLYLYNGDIIHVTKASKGWFKHEDGWSYGNNGKYLQITAPITQSVSITKVEQDDELNDSKMTQIDYGVSPIRQDYQAAVNYKSDIYQNYNTSTLDSFKGIHGLPFHHLNSTDIYMNKLTDSKVNYGRKFTEKILENMPLLLLSPGKPSFLDGYTSSEKSSFISNALGAFNGDKSELDNILNIDSSNGRYYTFKFDYANYYKYVNGMIWAHAQLLGIGDESMYGSTCGKYDWSKFSDNNELRGFFSSREFVAFYIDAEAQISESFSNSTGESMLDSGLNKMSDLGKEMDFLLGAGMGVKVDALNADNYDATMDDVNKMLGKFSSPSAVMDRLKSGLVTVAGGGQLIFPEIWKDSSFSKSYDITINLVSPNGDDKSIFKHIFVPMYHLMGLVVPQQMGMNGYRSPFLIRGFYKGIFNVDMGIITNMSIEKGGEGSWNANGLPTEMKITLSIKDLYEILTMTNYVDSVKDFIKNTPMLDFIANMAGVSINQPELFRTTEMWLNLRTNAVTQSPRNAWLNVSNALSNSLRGVFR